MKINEIITESTEEIVDEGKTGPGLWANIAKKRASGDKMRKKGQKGAPTEKALKAAQASSKNESVQLDEIDFASGLGDLALPHEQIINQSSVDGTIGSRKVYLFNSGPNKIYFFMNGQKIDALVYLFDNRVTAMKNFSPNKGLIYNLFQYIINIKRQRVRLTPEDKLTSYGIKWIIDQINRPTGFKITDTNGNKIDPSELYKEWENARITGNAGPTEIVIGESKNGKQLRENERRLMPMDIFGSTLVENKDQNVSRIQMMNILESGTRNFKAAASEGVAEGSRDDAFAAGHNAFHSGETKNPYKPGSQELRQWDLGWETAQSRNWDKEGVAGRQLEETYHNDDEFFEAYGVMEYNDEMINESEYQGRKVTLNKPMQGDVKKFLVYVKDPKTGNIKKVNFGQKGARIKKNNPGRRKNFRARHNCDNPGPKTGARYWSCRKW